VATKSGRTLLDTVGRAVEREWAMGRNTREAEQEDEKVRRKKNKPIMSVIDADRERSE